MSDLIERLEEVAETLEGSSYDWNHERAAMIREAIAEIKRLRKENGRLRRHAHFKYELDGGKKYPVLPHPGKHLDAKITRSCLGDTFIVSASQCSPAPSRPAPEQGA